MANDKPKTCSNCGKKLTFLNTTKKEYKGGILCAKCATKIPESKISEIRATCQSCGNIWHYGKSDEVQNIGSAMQQAGKAMMCCTGCVPALLIPTKQVVDYNKCPKCGSKAVKKETVVHEIE